MPIGITSLVLAVISIYLFCNLIHVRLRFFSDLDEFANRSNQHILLDKKLYANQWMSPMWPLFLRIKNGAFTLII